MNAQTISIDPSILAVLVNSDIPSNSFPTNSSVFNRTAKDEIMVTDKNMDKFLSQPFISKVNLGIDRSLIRLKAIGTSVSGCSMSEEEFDKDKLEMEKRKFGISALNDEQNAVWEYIKEHPKEICTIQAGPGCGKSYVLKTIAYNCKERVNVIIYKHDLLHAFRYNSNRFTVAKFVMDLLNIDLYEYKALDKQLSSNLSAYEFMITIIALLKKASLGNMDGSLVFLDEYMIMPKPFLLISLMLLEYYKIGVIVCGDKDQLQNIYNSKHAILSSYDIANSFATKQFQLFKNERCPDSAYNEILDHFAQYSSDEKLDTYAYAMIAAIFPKQLIEPPEYNYIHLAAEHQELADAAHTLVFNKKYPIDFYTIDQSRLRVVDNVSLAKSNLQPTKAMLNYMAFTQPGKAPIPEKFLPYLPLVIGGRYYINKHSEHSQGTLTRINEDRSLTMTLDNGTTITINKNSKHEVMFDQHVDFLLDNKKGTIYGYPIYPAYFMTIHKCQGCTITENLDLILGKTNYQGLYVALSRVTTPNRFQE